MKLKGRVQLNFPTFPFLSFLSGMDVNTHTPSWSMSWSVLVWAVAGLHAAIDDPMSPVGGTGPPLRPRCTGSLPERKPACNADAPSPVKTHIHRHFSYPQIFSVRLPAATRKFFVVCVFISLSHITPPTFVGLASNMIWVMEAGGRIGLNDASSVPDGGCSFTFIDWWRTKGRVSTVYLCLY